MIEPGSAFSKKTVAACVSGTIPKQTQSPRLTGGDTRLRRAIHVKRYARDEEQNSRDHFAAKRDTKRHNCHEDRSNVQEDYANLHEECSSLEQDYSNVLEGCRVSEPDCCNSLEHCAGLELEGFNPHQHHASFEGNYRNVVKELLQVKLES